VTTKSFYSLAENNMAIKPKCDKCKKELKEFGGILLSPPDKKGLVKKFHLCQACYKGVADCFGDKKSCGA